MNTPIERNIHIGCAGWTIAKEHTYLFAGQGTHLERYAMLFDSVEINSTFYRLPKAETVVKWREMVPPGFRFSVKMSKAITHLGRLKDLSSLPMFVERMSLLDAKQGPLLVQLPPSLSYDEPVALQFFSALRSLYAGPIAFEPRHVSWFAPVVAQLLVSFAVAVVAADPVVSPAGTVPGAWEGLAYYRLHGSPVLYHSAYSEAYLQALETSVRSLADRRPVWVIFDNTASGAAVGNAVSMKGSILAKTTIA